jgi:outer membrane protein
MRPPEQVMVLTVALVMGVALLCLGGCATSALDLAPAHPDEPWVPPASASGSAPAGYILPPDAELANVPLPGQLESAKVYSLPELIDIAQSSNPLTRIAWNDARRVALGAGIAASAYLPQLSASAIGGYQASSGHDAAPGTPVLGSGSAGGAVAAVSLQWLLFDFGGRAGVVDMAKQASMISNIAFTAVHQKLIYAVSEAFYAQAAAQARVATAEQSFQDSQAIQSAAQARYQHGVGTVIEVNQARLGLAQAEFARVQAAGAAQDAQLALLTAMGISPLTKIRIADVSGRQLPPSLPPPAQAVLAQALSRRPDVQSAFAAEQASLAHVRAARAEFMPKIFLAGNATYSSAGLDVTALPAVGEQGPTVNVSGSRFGGSIFAGFTVPIYDGGMRAAVLDQAKAEVDSAQAWSTQVKEDAVRQIVMADNALRTSLSSFHAAESLTEAAQTNFNAGLAAYRNGVGSGTDVSLAETQLLQARNAASDAYSGALTAAATLALASGALGTAPQ